ncbi:MAG: hypothetical protein ACODAE_07040, partial [Gemmatimonadota bacterium]
VLAGVGEGELVQIIVLLFTGLMAAGFFVPVMAGIVWRRGTKQGAIAAMIGGIAATLAWNAWGPADLIHPVVPGVLASLALMIGVSLVTAPPPATALEPYFGERRPDGRGTAVSEVAARM